MDKKQVLSLLATLIILLTSGSLAGAKSIEDIVGESPNIKTVNEKLTELQEYTIAKFSDVKADSWFLASVSKLTALKGISGYPDGTFLPQNSTTTAEFLAMLLASMGYKQEAGQVEWYDNYVEKAKELMIVESLDKYNYKEGIKRKDMAKMICKMVEVKPVSRQTVFKDVEGIDTKWIDAGYEEYLIRGYYDKGERTYKPNQTATRAEVSEMVVRAIEYYDDPEAFKEKMKKVYEESEKQQGEPTNTTVNMNGFIVPKPEYTDLDLSWDDIDSDAAREYGLDLDIGVNVFGPLEKQYEQLEEILLQVFVKDTVNGIMELVKKKKERYDLPPNQFLVFENRAIVITYSPHFVNLLVYEKGSLLD